MTTVVDRVIRLIDDEILVLDVVTVPVSIEHIRRMRPRVRSAGTTAMQLPGLPVVGVQLAGAAVALGIRPEGDIAIGIRRRKPHRIEEARAHPCLW